MTSQMTSQRDRILEAAARRKGIPYRLDPPPDGVTTLDCSLFVKLTLDEADIALPATVRTAEPRPNSLIFETPLPVNEHKQKGSSHEDA